MIPTTPTIITDTTMIQIITVQTTEAHPGIMAITMEMVRYTLIDGSYMWLYYHLNEIKCIKSIAVP